MRRSVPAIALLAILAAAGPARAAGAMDAEAAFEAASKARIEGAAAELARVGPGYVLVIGDSNAERLKAGAAACPGPFVNAGIGGISAEPLERALTGMRIPDGGAAAVLNVGTGNLWRGRSPLSPESMASFDAAVSSMVRRIAPHVRRMVVTALPPLSGRPATKLDPDGVAIYSNRIRALCERLGCVYADPWAPIRGASFGTARAGTVTDGLHPDDPGAAYASIAPSICPQGRVAAP